MEESRIVRAIAQFIEDYAWDKSLTTSSRVLAPSSPPVPDTTNALEEFVNGHNATRE